MKNILWDFSDYTKIVDLPLPVLTEGTEDMGDGVYKLKAGTPLDSSTPAVANTDDADCIVAEDYFFITTNAQQPKLVKVVEKGYVDLAAAEESFGGSYTDDAKAALAEAGIVLVDGALPSGGGGGGALVVTDTLGELDKTFAEIKAAYDAGMVCILKSADEVVGSVAYFTGYETPNSKNPNYEVAFVLLSESNFVCTYTSATENGVLQIKLGGLDDPINS